MNKEEIGKVIGEATRQLEKIMHLFKKEDEGNGLGGWYEPPEENRWRFSRDTYAKVERVYDLLQMLREGM